LLTAIPPAHRWHGLYSIRLPRSRSGLKARQNEFPPRWENLPAGGLPLDSHRVKVIRRLAILGLATVSTLVVLYLVTRDDAEAPERGISPALLAPRPCGMSSSPPRTFEHVIWLWMENKTYSQ